VKIDRLETHDRLLHFKKDQAINIAQGAEDCLKRNSLSLALQERSPYVYLFAHPRTADDGVTKIMWWQPRLTKPSAQTNSYLFRAVSKSDIMEVIWLLPPEELWGQYKKGNVTEDELITYSINQFRFNRKELEAAFKDDLPDEAARNIYREVIFSLRQPKLKILEASEASWE
jgi:hypothetical protein